MRISSAAEIKEISVCQNLKQYTRSSNVYSITYKNKKRKRHYYSIEIAIFFYSGFYSRAQISGKTQLFPDWERQKWRKYWFSENNLFRNICSSTVLLSMKPFFWWWFSLWRALHKNNFSCIHTQESKDKIQAAVSPRLLMSEDSKKLKE